MDPVQTLGFSINELTAAVASIADSEFEAKSNCGSWTVRQLVSHALNNQLLWAGVVSGCDIVSVDVAMGGVPIDGDLVPVAADVAKRSVALWGASEVLTAMHMTPFGELPGSVVINFPIFDALVHAWDIFMSVGRPIEFTNEALAAISVVAESPFAEGARAAGLIGPPLAPPADATETERLMAAIGRSSRRTRISRCKRMDDEAEIRFKIAVARRILYRAGLDQDDIAGQVTARVHSEDALWTTALELFDETQPHHVVKLPFGSPSSGDDIITVDRALRPVAPASKWVEAIYRSRPDVNCVIHTHAPYVVAVASTGETVQPYANRSLVFYDDQSYYDDDGTNINAPGPILEALGDKSVLIMRNHGAAIVADSIETATALTLLLEKSAMHHVLAKMAGGKPFPDQPSFTRTSRDHRNNLLLLWEAHVRRMRRTDFDLFADRAI